MHPLVLWCVYGLAARYGFQFVWLTLTKGGYKEASAKLLFYPYFSDVWMFVVLRCGALLRETGFQPDQVLTEDAIPSQM